MRRLLDTLRRRMPDDEEHQPGDRAPATAHYEELNVFGSPTGAVVHVREGDGFRVAAQLYVAAHTAGELLAAPINRVSYAADSRGPMPKNRTRMGADC